VDRSPTPVWRYTAWHAHVLMGKVGDDVMGQVVRQSCLLFAALRRHDRGCRRQYFLHDHPEPPVSTRVSPQPGANQTFCANDVDYDRWRRRTVYLAIPANAAVYENDGVELANIMQRARATGA